jgi:cell wall-associated NlpC family hydrolase
MDVIPRWVDKYRGIPFAEDGYTREGLHCWGLCRLVYQEQLGIELPRYPFGASDRKAIVRAMREGRAEYIAVLHEPKPFDLVLMSPIGHSAVWHIGVMVSRVHCLHIEEGTDAHVDLLTDPLMKVRNPTFHRHPTLA